MKLRVLLGTLALSLAASFLVPSSVEASSRYRRYSHHPPAVRVYGTYRSPYAYDDRYRYADDYRYRYDRYDDRYDRYGYCDDGYDSYYRPSVRYYRPYSYYQPYRYYRPYGYSYRSYRPLLGLRIGGPHFGVYLGW